MNGAVSKTGVSEAPINLSIALKLQKLLEQSGAEVVLTRSDENSIYDENSKTIREKKKTDLQNRVKIGNESSADIFVSIHLNKISDGRYWGWQCFYKNENEKSIKLANAIQNNLNATIKKDNKRKTMKIENIYIVDHVEVPITIVECGFLSNQEEVNSLVKDSYQNEIAWGIYNGIIEYFQTN